MRPHDENQFLVAVKSEVGETTVDVLTAETDDAIAADLVSDLEVGDLLYIVPLERMRGWRAVPKGVELRPLA